jgi:hypothetical protein
MAHSVTINQNSGTEVSSLSNECINGVKVSSPMHGRVTHTSEYRGYSGPHSIRESSRMSSA